MSSKALSPEKAFQLLLPGILDDSQREAGSGQLPLSLTPAELALGLQRGTGSKDPGRSSNPGGRRGDGKDREPGGSGGKS